MFVGFPFVVGISIFVFVEFQFRFQLVFFVGWGREGRRNSAKQQFNNKMEGIAVDFVVVVVLAVVVDVVVVVGVVVVD